MRFVPYLARRQASLPSAVAAAWILAAGCAQVAGPEAIVYVPQEASFDHYFFTARTQEELSEEELRERADSEIERLATPIWRSARRNLFRLGKPAIEALIDNLDRNELSAAGKSIVPGPAARDSAATYSLGQVAYAVLLEFVTRHTSYGETDIPPLDKAEWRRWWREYGRQLQVRDEALAIPRYVRDQLAERAELAATLFPDITPETALEKIVLPPTQPLDRRMDKKDRRRREREREKAEREEASREEILRERKAEIESRRKGRRGAVRDRREKVPEPPPEETPEEIEEAPEGGAGDTGEAGGETFAAPE